MKRILMLMLIVCLGVGFMPNSMAFASNEEADVQTILDNMTTQQKITQCMMVDCR